MSNHVFPQIDRRMRPLRVLLLMCAVHLLAAGSAVAQALPQTLTILVEDAADPWSKSDGTGYSNDVVVAAFKAIGIEARLKVVPYARCKHQVLNGDVVACFNMTWQPELEGKVRLAEQPIYRVNNDVFESLDAPLPKPADGQCSLPPGTLLGITRDYEYSPQVVALETAGTTFESAQSDLQSLKKLAAHRIQAALVITNDLQDKMQRVVQAGTQKAVRFAFNCGTTTGTLGFSLAHPDGLRALHAYEEGYRQIQANGVLQQIHARWFP